MMEKDGRFYLKSMVNFLEENGYRVREACYRPPDGRWYLHPEIKVEISRKEEKALYLHDAVNALADIGLAEGFTVIAAKEVYPHDTHSCPVAVWMRLKALCPASQEPSTPDHGQAERGC
jgi:hypothetical protein